MAWFDFRTSGVIGPAVLLKNKRPKKMTTIFPDFSELENVNQKGELF